MGAKIILGGGVAGLSAAQELCELKAAPIIVIEKEAELGGLARTHVHDGFRYDLGAHVLLSGTDSPTRPFFQQLAGPELLEMAVNAPYYVRGVFLNLQDTRSTFRPLRFRERARVRRHYAWQKLRQRIYETELISQRDQWLAQFGKGAYALLVEPYGNKLWGGLGCQEIMAYEMSNGDKNTWEGNPFVDIFRPAAALPNDQVHERKASYLRDGIGRIAARLIEAADPSQVRFLINTRVERIDCENDKITAVSITRGETAEKLFGDQFVSSMPITELMTKLQPPPPPALLQLSQSLRFRAMIFVALFINKPHVDSHTWVYVVEPRLPYLRYADMANRGETMNPPGKTSMIFEYCCEPDDAMWRASDDELVATTLQAHEANFKHFTRSEILGYQVHRLRHAYAVHTLDYKEKLAQINHYLRRFKNLHLIGSGGTFSVGSIGHSVASGLRAAKKICGIDFGNENVPAHG